MVTKSGYIHLFSSISNCDLLKQSEQTAKPDSQLSLLIYIQIIEHPITPEKVSLFYKKWDIFFYFAFLTD